MLPDELERYQTHHLFVLIGANPLPNYVAARLLAPQDGRVYLLHSSGTLAVADSLQRALRQTRPDLKVEPHEIDDTDAALIRKEVEPLARAAFATRQTVGLNYTGGTKPMALHIARLLIENGDPVLSYLDPRQLELVIEPRGAQQPQHIRVGRVVQLTLQELVELHGYTLADPRQTPKPRVLELARELHPVYQTHKGLKAWYEYCKSLGRDEESDAEAEQEKKPREIALPDGDRLRQVRRVMVQMTGKDAATPDEVALAMEEMDKEGKPFPYASYGKVFRGEWLEEYALAQLANAAQQLKFSDYGIALKPRKKIKRSNGKEEWLEMDLDLAALYGYQLFAISCQATDRKENAKEHFLELVVRAQQLGGEEARFGLVCFLDNEQAEFLRNEVQEEWGAPDRIRVFGRREQFNLAGALQEWIWDASNPKPKANR